MTGAHVLVSPGEIIANKFRVERIVGEGGMGVVFAATHLQLEQLVAIKIIRPEALSNREVVARFLKEARTAARLRSEHVTRVIDVGETTVGWPYIVMEYLQGQDLASVVAERGPLPVAEAIDYVLQACDAVSEAHELGIVHRDLKPANLYLSQTAHGKTAIKVLDFGIAKTAATDWTMTQPAAVMGSPGYMSPEQLRSTKDVDGRTDIWSLAVILWELVTGKAPFCGDTLTEICVRIAVDPLPSFPSIGGLTAGVENVLRRALEKDRDRRYANVGELAAALSPFTHARGRELARRIQGARTDWSRHDAPAVANVVPRSKQGRRKLRRWLGAGALAAGLVRAVFAIPSCNDHAKSTAQGADRLVPPFATQPVSSPVQPARSRQEQEIVGPGPVMPDAGLAASLVEALSTEAPPRPPTVPRADEHSNGWPGDPSEAKARTTRSSHEKRRQDDRPERKGRIAPPDTDLLEIRKLPSGQPDADPDIERRK